MDLNYLKKLLKIVNESGVDEVEIEEEGSKVRVKKSPTMKDGFPPSYFPFPTPSIPVVNATVSTEHLPSPVTEIDKAKTEVKEEKPHKYHEIKSPIVGTFYRAPSPDAEPYVKVGDTVSVGTVLCIVEAMKLMNEIESDVNGKIVKILVENAKPVEYGQVLFFVEV